MNEESKEILNGYIKEIVKKPNLDDLKTFCNLYKKSTTKDRFFLDFALFLDIITTNIIPFLSEEDKKISRSIIYKLSDTDEWKVLVGFGCGYNHNTVGKFKTNNLFYLEEMIDIIYSNEIFENIFIASIIIANNQKAIEDLPLDVISKLRSWVDRLNDEFVKLDFDKLYNKAFRIIESNGEITIATPEDDSWLAEQPNKNDLTVFEEIIKENFKHPEKMNYEMYLKIVESAQKLGLLE